MVWFWSTQNEGQQEVVLWTSKEGNQLQRLGGHWGQGQSLRYWCFCHHARTHARTRTCLDIYLYNMPLYSTLAVLFRPNWLIFPSQSLCQSLFFLTLCPGRFIYWSSLHSLCVCQRLHLQPASLWVHPLSANSVAIHFTRSYSCTGVEDKSGIFELSTDGSSALSGDCFLMKWTPKEDRSSERSRCVFVGGMNQRSVCVCVWNASILRWTFVDLNSDQAVALCNYRLCTQERGANEITPSVCLSVSVHSSTHPVRRIRIGLIDQQWHTYTHTYTQRGAFLATHEKQRRDTDAHWPSLRLAGVPSSKATLLLLCIFKTLYSKDTINKND